MNKKQNFNATFVMTHGYTFSWQFKNWMWPQSYPMKPTLVKTANITLDDPKKVIVSLYDIRTIIWNEFKYNFDVNANELTCSVEFVDTGKDKFSYKLTKQQKLSGPNWYIGKSYIDPQIFRGEFEDDLTNFSTNVITLSKDQLKKEFQ